MADVICNNIENDQDPCLCSFKEKLAVFVVVVVVLFALKDKHNIRTLAVEIQFICTHQRPAFLPVFFKTIYICCIFTKHRVW